MKLQTALLLLLMPLATYAQKFQVLDAETKTPVSFATISFGDGKGTFAGEDGVFDFPKAKYADIDSLHISAIGFKEEGFSTNDIPAIIALQPEASQLSEVIVTAPKRGKYKTKKKKSVTHEDIHTSWLPTVESEVAVLFKRYQGKSTRIAKLLLPINAETQYKSKGKGKFATIFRIQFYENDNGLPGRAISHEKIVFAINQDAEKVFELNIQSKQIFIPEEGIFASLQVLGYADDKGKLIQSKKYREVPTKRGVKKISTAFRPLLPFTNEFPDQKTYVRRIFLNNKKWQVFDKTYNENSNLIKSGSRNYGMGATFHVFEE
ncbi:peptidase associated/transthyretin-like domain-containing protein [Dokdonia pacifica]|uniref:CarboxypepD_reg-like domain-containing protein n=1 Tax=Dokdonia pacifica TaxID=1627892 RepID=A0A238W510_9FLAO|nr:carboxypeptidase-like regulatory domain-containing protein [Dokdonia pacifica]SNR41578.1 hypothetical protein SAMN06265376_101694 [Dokdonia pacifica]